MGRLNKYGFGLIEVLISVLLVVTVGSASLSLHFNSFRLADRAAVQTQAYYLATEGVEVLKILNYQGSVSFPGNGTKFLSEDLAVTDDASDGKVYLYGGRYYRIITVEDAFSDSDYAKIKVGVCFGPEAVSKSKCDAAELAKKNYIETLAVIKRNI
ncbi:MAG: hypothetical protein Q7S37_04835 [bacterium]|nr:hypothetical protein [bacterium]